MAFYMRKAANGYVIEELKSPLSVGETQIEDTWVIQGDAVEVVNEVIKILLMDDQVEATWIKPEQPQTPDPQSSKGESTETMVEALPDSPAAETIQTVVGEIDPMDEEDRAKYRRAIFASTETMVEEMAERLTKMQQEPDWMVKDRERDTMVENGLHAMSKPVAYGEVEVGASPYNGTTHPEQQD